MPDLEGWITTSSGCLSPWPALYKICANEDTTSCTEAVTDV